MIDQKHSKILSLGAFVFFATLVTGCTSDTPSSSYGSSSESGAAVTVSSYIRFSETAPPKPQPEVKPIIDIRTQIWRPGHWAYDNGQFTWVPGEVMQKPTFTAAWYPDTWEKHTYGWGFIAGHWQ